ncbi:unnamed protein product [Ectocarpus sp. CCAP 1310/34]|nr:unnamed protein product [Ectocarpus sp. CCAP 1310/34]
MEEVLLHHRMRRWPPSCSRLNEPVAPPSSQTLNPNVGPRSSNGRAGKTLPLSQQRRLASLLHPSEMAPRARKIPANTTSTATPISQLASKCDDTDNDKHTYKR